MCLFDRRAERLVRVVLDRAPAQHELADDRERRVHVADGADAEERDALRLGPKLGHRKAYGEDAPDAERKGLRA